MRALQMPASKFALGTALVFACAAGLSNPAHADRGRDRDGPRHGSSHDRGHHPRFDRHPGQGRFDGPRFHPAPRYHAYSHPAPRYYAYSRPAPLFSGSIVFRSAPLIAAPVLPPPRLFVPAPWYGVTELGPAW